MFKINTDYDCISLCDEVLQKPSVPVEEYPENNLPKIYVDGKFGDIEVVTSDIYDLFSQQRLDNLGPDVVRDFLARNLPKSSQASDIISNMSDDEIINSIKSKHIQQPSELLRWSRFVVQEIDDAVSSSLVDDSSKVDDSSTVTDNTGNTVNSGGE